MLARLARTAPSAREARKFEKSWGGDANYVDTMIGHTLSYPDWRSRFRYAWAVLFPPKTYIQERYHVRSPLLVPYYYAHRLGARAFQQALRLLRSIGCCTAAATVETEPEEYEPLDCIHTFREVD